MSTTRSLEVLFGKATNPENQEDDVVTLQNIQNFCACVNQEFDGHLVATRLIAHKIQSPLEQEAVLALLVLQACAKNCGRKFESEIGKFRFLNEMVKVVSPKYIGTRTPWRIKNMIFELLFSWTKEISHEPKIKEAYEMLKKQGIVKKDPVYPPNALGNESVSETPSPKYVSRMATFEDDEKARQLKKLLSSKNPEDLQAANRMIKNMVKDEERKVESTSLRLSKLQSVGANKRLLEEMLDQYSRGSSGDAEREIMKELHDSCVNLRTTLYRLASETDQDSGLGDIVEATEDLGRTISRYELLVVKGGIDPSKSQVTSLLDLDNSGGATSLIDDQLAALGLSSSNAKDTVDVNATKNSIPSLLGDTDVVSTVPAKVAPPSPQPQDNRSKALQDLDFLGESLMKQHLPPDKPLVAELNRMQLQESKVSLNDMQKSALNEVNMAGGDSAEVSVPSVAAVEANMNLDTGFDFLTGISSSSLDLPRKEQECNAYSTQGNDDVESVSSQDTSPLDISEEPKLVQSLSVPVVEVQPLTDINISLDEVKASPHAPLQILAANNVSVMLHFGKPTDRPREDVSVMVVVITSHHNVPLSNVIFHAVVPKSMKCKLMPASSSSLSAHSPFLPPTPISQVLLIANPAEERVNLKFLLTYTMEDDLITERGQVDIPSL